MNYTPHPLFHRAITSLVICLLAMVSLAAQSVSFGLRKDFFDKQLQLRITGADIFKTTNNYFYRGDYGGIEIDGVRSFDTQRFGLGITWKFGNQQAKTRKNANSALDEELNRINN